MYPYQPSSNIADLVCEFIEILIHEICFLRNLYPEVLFGTIRKYGVAVHICNHNQISEYIRNIVSAMLESLNLGIVDKVVIPIMHQNKVLERYVLEIRLNLSHSLNENNLVILCESFRSFLVKLACLDVSLKELPKCV